MNKHVYLGISILELSKILMNEFSYDYLKPEYGERWKLCYMNADSFIVYIKGNDVYKDIAADVETRFDIELDIPLNWIYHYELDTPLPKEKSNWINKNKLEGKVMTKFVELRRKTSSYLTDDGSEDKKTKGTKKCAI